MPAPACDIDNLMEVMQRAFDPAYGEAWTRRQVEDALLIGNCHYRLFETERANAADIRRCAGFYLSRTGFEEEELLLFAVRPSYRRRGIGRSILDRLFEDAVQRGARRILLEMRRGNPAWSLYDAVGFKQIGERRDYYRTPDGKRIDALTFEKALLQT